MTQQKDPLGVLARPEDGRVERPVVSPRWRVAASIRLVDGDRLQWQHGESEERSVEPSPGLLEDFLKLRDGSPAAVARYARRWGVLRLCEHDFPAGHPAEYWPTEPIIAHACPFDKRFRLTPEALEWDRYREHSDQFTRRLEEHFEKHGEIDSFTEPSPEPPEIESWEDPPWVDLHSCFPRGHQTDAPWEPISAWKTWAARAYALLSITAALRQGSDWTVEDWQVASGSERWINPATPDECWRNVERFSNCWLGAARVQPRLVLRNGAERLTLGSGGSQLFGALAVQLTLAVCGAEGFAVCDGCKDVYAPARKPRAGERCYCHECKDQGIPRRHASAAYRARKKKER